MESRTPLYGRLITVLEPDGAASEAYRTLRTNLLYALIDNPPRVIVVTSPGPREGKSTICANLGVVLARAEKSVLLLDCDLRKPMVHKIFGLRNFRGLVDVVVGDYTFREVWQEPQPGLTVVTTGTMTPNPTELLGSRRFAELLAQVRQDFDYVLLDTSPIALVSDPTVLATQADGVLLVADAQHTRKRALRRSVRSLEAVGATVLGTIMNNVKSSDKDLYYGQVYE